MEKRRKALKSLVKAIGIVLLILASSCNKQDTAKIKFTSNASIDGAVVIEEQRVQGRKILDSLELNRSGKLKYTVDLRQPTFITLHFQNQKSLFLLLFDGDNVKISTSGKGDSVQYLIDGSPESVKLNKLYDSLFAVRKVLGELGDLYYGSLTPKEQDAYYEEYTAVLKAYKNYSLSYILENLTSLTSIAALYQEISPNNYLFNQKKDLQFFKIVSDSLIKFYPKHRHVHSLRNNYEQMMSSYNIQRIMSTAETVSEGLPNLKLPDVSGDSVQLLSVKKSLVLLNIWNEQSESQVSLLPEFKQVYSKHKKNDFEIYNVYVGKDLKVWQRIVRFEELSDCINVADTAFPNSQTRISYNVQNLPSNYLLDLKEKTILAKDVNSGQLQELITNYSAN